MSCHWGQMGHLDARKKKQFGSLEGSVNGSILTYHTSTVKRNKTKNSEICVYIFLNL